MQHPPHRNKIAVHIRVRPPSLVESSSPNVVRPETTTRLTVDASGVELGLKTCTTRVRKTFDGFDHVYGPSSTQQDVYERSVHSVVDGAFDGINGAVLAYGPTGSGKTHTLFGYDTADGVVPQAARFIFQRKSDMERIQRKVLIECALYELYMDRVRDLSIGTVGRNKLNGSSTLRIVTTDTGTSISNLTWYSNLDDFASFKSWLDAGMNNRCHAPTIANEHSSRSHAFLAIRITVFGSRADAVSSTTRGMIKFCDLAGSERAAANHNANDRFKEGCNINSGLLALSNVVHSLSTHRAGSTKGNVCFRASPLTRLLQDCISGNVRACMVVCVSPAVQFKEETINALQFAQHAANIECRVQRNVGTTMAELEAYNAELLSDNVRLVQQLAALSAGQPGAAIPASSSLSSLSLTREMVDHASDPLELSELSGLEMNASSPARGAAAYTNVGSPIGASEGAFRTMQQEPWRSYMAQYEACIQRRDNINFAMRDYDEAGALQRRKVARQKALDVLRYFETAPDEVPPVRITTTCAEIDGLEKELRARDEQFKKLEAELLQTELTISALAERVKGEADSRAVNYMTGKFDAARQTQVLTDHDALSQYFLAKAEYAELRQQQMSDALSRQNKTIDSLWSIVETLQRCAPDDVCGKTSMAALKREVQVTQAYAAAALVDDVSKLVEEFRARSRSLKIDLHQALSAPAGGGMRSVRLDMLGHAASVQRRRTMPATPTWVTRLQHHAAGLAIGNGDDPVPLDLHYPGQVTAPGPANRPSAKVRPAPPQRPMVCQRNTLYSDPLVESGAYRPPLACATTPYRAVPSFNDSASGAPPPPPPVVSSPAPALHVALGVAVPLRIVPHGGAPPSCGTSSHNTSTSSVGTPPSAPSKTPDFTRTNTAVSQPGLKRGLLRGSHASFHRTATAVRVERGNKENANTAAFR